MHAKRTGHAAFKDETDTTTTTAIDAIGASDGVTDAEAELGREPEVDATLRGQLEEMGFGHHRTVRALYATATANSIEAAIAWLAEHEGDADIDEPLLIKIDEQEQKNAEKASSTISPEEAKQRAAELIRKAKERREQEERENEKRREQERIRMGKELAAMAREEEATRLRRLAEERQRDKDEAERAKAKIKKKLEEDRKERRRRQGLPEELTEEEKEEEKRREMEKLKAEASQRQLYVRPVTVSEQMRNLLVEMKKSNSSDDQELRLAWSTLLKFVTNVATCPEEPKYRSIRLTNAAVQSRIGKFPETVDFLRLCGFGPSDSNEDDGTVLHLPFDRTDRAILEAAAENLNSALTNPFFGVL